MHELVEPLYSITHRAGELLRSLYVRHLDQPLQVDSKADASPVTEADRRCNALLQRELALLRPDWPVLSEETEAPDFEQRRRWRDYWLVDPLDGTREFIEGTGHFCISIAHVREHRAHLGAIYLPLTAELYIGGAEQPPLCYTPHLVRALHGNARPSDTGKVLCSRRGRRDPRIVAFCEGMQQRFARVDNEVRGSAWKFCRLAEGGGDVYPRFGATSEWDTAAGQALLEAAGGAVLDLDGEPLRYNCRTGLENPPFIAMARSGETYRDLME